ncbi:DUF6710 family protein [Lactococcus lactis]|uniref:Uncharacterized protein n=1 Tax=Lactococcus lactis subsp. lactis TaxID=1360 RepID=A0A2N5WAC8_LACLL|nr:DUF6710 family protein [Lactococcus lactis]PLW59168.1 hypothetical protein CYU10_000006 [Lactococcus lactis subsp. lactis]
MVDFKRFFLQKKDNVQETEVFSEKKLEFDRIITAASKIIESYQKTDESELHPIYAFSKQFSDFITSKIALKSYALEADSDEVDFSLDQLLKISFLKEYVIQTDFYVREEDYGISHKTNTEVYDGDFTLSLGRMPFIVSPWNYKRTTTQILEMEVPKNKFDSESFNWNLNNILYYPIGLVNCRGGNHSQYVAKLKSDVQTRIRTVLNIEQLYDFVHFNGSQFEYNYPNDPASLFEKDYTIKNEDEFYYGVLFEIGRLILKWDIEKDIIPKNIKNVIKQLHKV